MSQVQTLHVVIIASLLHTQIDYDVCSNYGNWLYSAGIGNDPRENRKFNMIKQGLDYDSNVCIGKWMGCCILFVSDAHDGCCCNVNKTARQNFTGIIGARLLANSFRVTMCGGGFPSCRASREQTCTRPGFSALPRCHMLVCPSVRRTQPPLSSQLNGADTLTRNRWVFEKKEVDSMIVCYCCIIGYFNLVEEQTEVAVDKYVY